MTSCRKRRLLSQSPRLLLLLIERRHSTHHDAIHEEEMDLSTCLCIYLFISLVTKKEARDKILIRIVFL